MTKANRKKIAKELLAAAERIENFENMGCCSAIQCDEARRYFNAIFQEDAFSLGNGWSYWFSDMYDRSQYQSRPARVLGLCWAALMAEEGVF